MIDGMRIPYTEALFAHFTTKRSLNLGNRQFKSIYRTDSAAGLADIVDNVTGCNSVELPPSQARVHHYRCNRIMPIV